MSTLAADVAFDFTYPTCEPSTPPTACYSYNPSLLEIPYQHHPSHGHHSHHHGHARSVSQCSAYSAYSIASSSPSDSFLSANGSVNTAPSTRTNTPARSPIRTHGPLLLPKIRSQDQALGDDAHGVAFSSPPKRAKTSPVPSMGPRGRSTATANSRRSTHAVARHARSFTNRDPIMFGSRSFSEDSIPATASAPVSRSSSFEATPPPPTLLCSPVNFAQQYDGSVAVASSERRASCCSLDDADNGSLDKYGYEFFTPYPGTVPAYMPSSSGTSIAVSDMIAVSAASAAMTSVTSSTGMQQGPYMDQHLYQRQQPYTPRAPSPLSETSHSASVTPEPMPVPTASTGAPAGPTSTLLRYLTGSNPAPALVRNISFPLRDPNTKHFWWDVRQVRAWSAFTAGGLLSLPGATSVLSCPVPVSLLPTPPATRNHPETEAELHAICAAHYVPRVNAALTLSSGRPLQLASAGETFVARVGSNASATSLFGGKPTARVVGLVKSFDRFNTGMRAEGNVKKVEYLRGLAHLHYLMREHSCRYGFILTEIELVVVRNGIEPTPFFGQVEVASVPLAKTAEDPSLEDTPLTACLALWGLCMLASDEMAAAAAGAAAGFSNVPTGTLLCSHHIHIGAPAEGTRQKAANRDAWMPPPQLAEKRAAKRARGWIMPEDTVGRKEMGRRGVKYGGGH